MAVVMQYAEVPIVSGLLVAGSRSTVCISVFEFQSPGLIIVNQCKQCDRGKSDTCGAPRSYPDAHILGHANSWDYMPC
jgi:hypothetical protein